MANIKSQIKRNRQNDKRRLRNRAYRGTARIMVKEARVAIEDGVPESQAALLKAISALDKAAERGVIHKNNAARRKSRLMKAFARMEPAEAAPAMTEPAAEAEAPKKAASRQRAAEPVAEAKAKKTTAKKASASSEKGKKPAAAAKKKTAAKASPKGK